VNKRHPHLVFNLLLTCFLCSGLYADTGSNQEPHDVIDVKEYHLSTDYWTDKISGQDQPATHSAIPLLNNSFFELSEDMVRLSHISKNFSGADLIDKIGSISKPSATERHYANGRTVTQQDYANYYKNMNLDPLRSSAQPQTIRWSMVVKRTSMRTFPTTDRIFKPDSGTDLDRFQETGLFPSDILAILHESADGLWYFAQSYNYLAWVQKKDVALGSRSEIFAYAADKEFITVTGSKVNTTYIPGKPAISELQLDMGTTLPLVPSNEHKNNVHGQNPYASFVVLLPTRLTDGTLKIERALIARNKDLHRGYLPYTEKNLVRQSFKFLGERYGWGESYNARDCTGFVGAVYKTFGLMMPRNSGDQGKSRTGINLRFSANTPGEEKLDDLEHLNIGDLIYIPGHVMMYIGHSNGQPFVIHDVVGLAYNDSKGDFYQGVLNGVSVTPLIPLRLSKSTSYTDKIYNIKSLR